MPKQPKDLSVCSNKEIAEHFAPKDRSDNVLKEFSLRTQGKVVVDAQGLYLPDLNEKLMERIAKIGYYNSDRFIVADLPAGFVISIQHFLRGGKEFHNPFTGEVLDEDGNDPTLGVKFPVSDIDQMRKIAFLALPRQFSSNDVDEIHDIIDMVTGELAYSRKMIRQLEDYDFALANHELDLNLIEQLLFENRPKSTPAKPYQNAQAPGGVSIGGNAVRATIITGNGNVNGNGNRVNTGESESTIAAILRNQRSQPLNMDQKAAIVVKLRGFYPQKLHEAFCNGGYESQSNGYVSPIADFLAAFYVGRDCTREHSPERDTAIEFFRKYATEEHWKSLQAAIAQMDKRLSQLSPWQ